ncbi:xanthine dehydrogenase family protein subunit M [Polymorphobacter sp. PAMC 29334]|uniref:FAD binding domain-containing protein n=1 Tax=Polymorphobacter sp. PAMC 29334 TaxID=2862331 RepID=UPI001C679F66|nr:xanthine dehydrogenase family protein subunit M [Polymorphobacter sp. PAMC 29334]QYE35117.1 xanthine dehydrogenase family protein subunit M [Polymorphobacter sp. PAMC 29334]
MRPFMYSLATDAPEAVRQATVPADAHVRAPVQLMGGGTTLLDLMKLDVMRPDAVIDITPLATARYGNIEASATELRLGALVRMSDAAEDHAVVTDYPVIAQSLGLAASQQLRNMARLGGNALQRTRCSYFRDPSYEQCNKRNPGSGCAAIDGFNRLHAVLGTSEHCIASYPGDFAQALIALDATVEVLGAGGARSIRFADLHRLPGSTPHIETSLAPGEMITAYVVPAGPWTRRSAYIKVRDRESYAFALASVAVALDMDGTMVRSARIALGGVATVPWRAAEAEALLAGKPLDEAAAHKAADAAFAGAKTHEHNAYKVPLGKATLVRALLTTQAMEL